MNNLYEELPLIENIRRKEEVFWLNNRLDNRLSAEIARADIKDAAERLERFAPYIKAVFPETGEGLIESPLNEIREMQDFLLGGVSTELNGRLFLKCDSHLPISGSIKARGGIYEVLCFAEKIALENGMLCAGDDYSVLADQRFAELFSGYSITVGSTGNLGLSIGIIGAKMGFKVNVHISVDAKKWKKDLLTKIGANVVQHEGDYGKAVEEGRKQAEKDACGHFVDDEKSKTLFLGYSVAGERLARQLAEKGIIVDDKHPLFVYLPCGVGGGPGGVTYGLKQIYGKNVHCFFAEPVEAPCMMLGVMTGLYDKICVQDVGLSGVTIADGLAVARCSGLVGRLCGNLLDGLFTVSDNKMEQYVRDLYEREGIFIEPSAASGFLGYIRTRQRADYIEKIGIDKMKNAVHIVWATGGSMVPPTEREKCLLTKG